MTAPPRAAWLGAFVAATVLSFPHPVAGRIVDLGWLLGWVGPACLVLSVQGLAPRAAAGRGFLVGWAAHALILHWIYHVTVTYGHAPVWVGFLAPAALALYGASFVALFAAGFASWAPRGAAAPWFAAAWWTALDHLRSFALTGFPWATLGYAQHDNPALLPWTAWTGVYGLSFLTVLGGVGVLWAVRARGRAGTWLAPAGVGLALAAGPFLAAEPAGPDAPRVRVAVVQGNIDQGVKWSPAWADRTFAIYERLSRAAAAGGAEWIVWPETAVPGAVNRSEEVQARLRALAAETGATLVVGAVAVEVAPAGDHYLFYDSAFVVTAEAGVAARYDKAQLVPFGEYVPLRDLLGRFFQALARGIARDNVTAGPGPRALAVPRPGPAGAVTAGVPICYELIFPDLMRRFVRDGAGVLLAITNDAWYGRTGAPYQFLAMTAVRSAETRVWTARAANTGVSALIDARGRVRRRTGIFEEGYLVEDVPIRPPSAAGRGGSFYARHGDVFAGGCWLAALAGAAVAITRRRRRPGA